MGNTYGGDWSMLYSLWIGVELKMERKQEEDCLVCNAIAKILRSFSQCGCDVPEPTFPFISLPAFPPSPKIIWIQYEECGLVLSQNNWKVSWVIMAKYRHDFRLSLNILVILDIIIGCEPSEFYDFYSWIEKLPKLL